MALLSFEAIRDGFRTDPSFYVQAIDPVREAALILRLNEPALRHASFLDDRILSPRLEGRWTPWADVMALAPPAPAQPLHFIFHAGHVGSTLLSRLLDGLEGVLGLREPLPLRTLASALPDIEAPHALLGAAQWDALLKTLLASWGRGFPTTRTVVVKATSSASVCARPILAALPQARGVLLNLNAEPYMAALLAGENSPLDLRGHAPERMRRLVALAGPPAKPLHALSLGEIAAMTWAVERLTHGLAGAEAPGRTLQVDFESLLDEPAAALHTIAAHFNIAATPAQCAAVAHGEALTRYAKAPEHAYSPALRLQVLAASRDRNRGEIAMGLRWLDAFTKARADLAPQLSA